MAFSWSREPGRIIMSMLVTRCPRYRTKSNTGIAADEHTMHQLGPKLEVLVLCDSRREYQRMMVKDLYVGRAPERAAAWRAI